MLWQHKQTTTVVKTSHCNAPPHTHTTVVIWQQPRWKLSGFGVEPAAGSCCLLSTPLPGLAGSISIPALLACVSPLTGHLRSLGRQRFLSVHLSLSFSPGVLRFTEQATLNAFKSRHICNQCTFLTFQERVVKTTAFDTRLATTEPGDRQDDGVRRRNKASQPRSLHTLYPIFYFSGIN